MEIGSTIAQVLASVEGVSNVSIEGSALQISLKGQTARNLVVAEVSATLRDRFL